MSLRPISCSGAEQVPRKENEEILSSHCPEALKAGEELWDLESTKVSLC